MLLGWLHHDEVSAAHGQSLLAEAARPPWTSTGRIRRPPSEESLMSSCARSRGGPRNGHSSYGVAGLSRRERRNRPRAADGYRDAQVEALRRPFVIRRLHAERAVHRSRDAARPRLRVISRRMTSPRADQQATTTDRGSICGWSTSSTRPGSGAADAFATRQAKRASPLLVPTVPAVRALRDQRHPRIVRSGQ